MATKKKAPRRKADPQEVMPKTKSSPAKFDALVKGLNAKVKREVFCLGTSKVQSDVAGYISTGCYPLDLKLGRTVPGGMPMGRIIELQGAQSAGKTTAMAHLFASVQRGRGTRVEWVPDASGFFRAKVVSESLEPGIAVLIEPESTWDKPRAQMIGVDLEDLIHVTNNEDSAPLALEDMFDFLDPFVEMITKEKKYASMPVVIAIDTLAAAPTREEMKGKAGRGGLSEKARIVKYELRRYTQRIAARQILFVIVNQVMDRIGVVGLESPGGRGIRHHASHRFRVQKTGNWMLGTQHVGILSDIYMIKSKVQAPTIRATVPIRFEDGIDDAHCVFEFLAEKKNWDTQKVGGKEVSAVPIQRGAWNTFPIWASEKEFKFREGQWRELYASDEGLRKYARYLAKRNILEGVQTPEDPTCLP